MKSVMNHAFSNVPSVQIPRSRFNRSFGRKMTFDSAYLYPVYCDEALPGDSFKCRMSAFARMSTPIYPIMDNLYLSTFFFAVPVRILVDNFKKMMGEQDNPADSIDYIVPVMDVTAAPLSTTGYTEGSLSDYFGIPTKVANLEHNVLWHRAYNKIWNDWFRDQNLQDSVPENRDDGPDDPTDYVLLKRGKRHDYFTSCLPWPVKGGVEVNLPLGISAPIEGFGAANQAYVAGPVNVYETDKTSTVSYASYKSASLYMEEDPNSTGWPNIRADLTNATAATINQLREAFQIQRMLERDARGGTRYNELVLSHFRVTIPDYRIQRSEYLGGGKSPINVTPVANTAANLGELGAFAVTGIRGHGFTKSFTEHSVILGLVCVHADLTYQQGLPRMFSRSTRYDFYWPSLANLGEQPVYNKEIYAQGTTADDDVFGYQERWAEYRYKPSEICGAFRSNAATPLDAWHLSQEFASLPGLNSAFIEENPPVSRVVATPSEPEFIFDSFFDLQCARPMPMYSVPGLIDHF